MSLPHLVKLRRNTHHLMVQDEPFFWILGGELNNSSFSSVEHMELIWNQMVENNLNTVLGSVAWEQIEPEENCFDFRFLDQQIKSAREYGLKLILLWFGAHKNGMGIYAPHWVKTDRKRFPRVEISVDGKLNVTTTLSVFEPRTMEADAKAFQEFMKHLKEIDDNHNTVVMVQVENEVGILEDSRDRSEIAELAFNSSVPEILLETIKKEWNNMSSAFRYNFDKIKSDQSKLQPGKSWEETFGKSIATDELFMAYHYALYLEGVSKEGKKEYGIPLFTNVALRNPSNQNPNGDNIIDVSDGLGGGESSGIYPSGGPVETVFDIWQLFSPTLEFFAPDIYLRNYETTCQLYCHRDQPLFIPEQRRDEYGAIRIWEAIGSFNAIGISPFGIDTDHPSNSPFTIHYGLLKRFSGVILSARSRGNEIYGFYFDGYKKPNPDPSPIRTIIMGNWQLIIKRQFVFGQPSPGFGIVIQSDIDTFILLGEGYEITFEDVGAGSENVVFNGIIHLKEKEVSDSKSGELRDLRILNGDEVGNRSKAIMPSTDPDYGDFCICSWIPAKTRIAEVKVYSLT